MQKRGGDGYIVLWSDYTIANPTKAYIYTLKPTDNFQWVGMSRLSYDHHKHYQFD